MTKRPDENEGADAPGEFDEGMTTAERRRRKRRAGGLRVPSDNVPRRPSEVMAVPAAGAPTPPSPEDPGLAMSIAYSFTADASGAVPRVANLPPPMAPEAQSTVPSMPAFATSESVPALGRADGAALAAGDDDEDDVIVADLDDVAFRAPRGKTEVSVPAGRPDDETEAFELVTREMAAVDLEALGLSAAAAAIDGPAAAIAAAPAGQAPTTVAALAASGVVLGPIPGGDALSESGSLPAVTLRMAAEAAPGARPSGPMAAPVSGEFAARPSGAQPHVAPPAAEAFADEKSVEIDVGALEDDGAGLATEVTRGERAATVALGDADLVATAGPSAAAGEDDDGEPDIEALVDVVPAAETGDDSGDDFGEHAPTISPSASAVRLRAASEPAAALAVQEPVDEADLTDAVVETRDSAESAAVAPPDGHGMESGEIEVDVAAEPSNGPTAVAAVAAVPAVTEPPPSAGPPPPPPPVAKPPPAPPAPRRPTPPPRAGTAPDARKSKRGRAWFEEVFDEDYLRTLPFLTPQATQAEARFVVDALGVSPGAQLLDVGCGYGRHAMEIAARGYKTVGLDLSLPLLIRATDAARRVGVNVDFVHGDMRDMTFDGEFDAAYSFFTTFGYFDDDTNRRVAVGICKALRPGGRLVLDLINRDYLIGDLPTRVWWQGDGCVVLEEVDFNYFTSRLQVQRQIIIEDGRQLEQEISIRAYSLHEIGKVLHHAGFRVIEVSGGLDLRGRFYGNESRQLLVVAEKKAE